MLFSLNSEEKPVAVAAETSHPSSHYERLLEDPLIRGALYPEGFPPPAHLEDMEMYLNFYGPPEYMQDYVEAQCEAHVKR